MTFLYGWIIAGCDSSSGSDCPVCAQGYICDPATKTCVSDQGCSPPCGKNTICKAGSCTCLQGWTDCDGDRGNSKGNGCECDRGCQGTRCSGQTACAAEVVGFCGDETRYCNGVACQNCAPGSFNCDGLGPCEATIPCRCSEDVQDACGSDRHYCSQGTCLECEAGKHNCDGIGACECGGGCFAGSCPPTCDPECTGFIYSQCVKDPSKNNQCVDCLDDSHCAANPRSTGPRCDLASQLCVCDKNTDCASSASGHACRQVGNFQQCSCDNAADCSPPYSFCEGTVIKRCVKPCTENADCDRVGLQGFCDTASGRCEYTDL